jgi:hypothetical protein
VRRARSHTGPGSSRHSDHAWSLHSGASRQPHNECIIIGAALIFSAARWCIIYLRRPEFRHNFTRNWKVSLLHELRQVLGYLPQGNARVPRGGYGRFSQPEAYLLASKFLISLSVVYICHGVLARELRLGTAALLVRTITITCIVKYNNLEYN